MGDHYHLRDQNGVVRSLGDGLIWIYHEQFLGSMTSSNSVFPPGKCIFRKVPYCNFANLLSPPIPVVTAAGIVYQIHRTQELAQGCTARPLPMASEISPLSPVACEQRVLISNKYGEKLVGVLHQTGSKKLVILCHGFRATKDDSILVDLAAALTREGISAFRFDFAGNGESEGKFQYGNYRKEADDLRFVVSYFLEYKVNIIALVGHSKGGNAVLLYASMYHDVPIIVNISGRFALERGIDGRLGKNFMQRIKRDGYIDVKNKKGEFEYRVTEESLKDRLSTDTLVSIHSINKDCRILTIHGSKDEIVPVEDALMFAANIPNHKLHIIVEANHRYTNHEQELTSLVLDFIKSHRCQLFLCPKL